MRRERSANQVSTGTRNQLQRKWIKQHLRIKAFYGVSENAVKTQIWIAVSVYVLVAIVRKRLGLEASLYQILQILSLTLFRENAHFMRPSGHRRRRQFHRKRQPDSVQLLTGQRWFKVTYLSRGCALSGLGPSVSLGGGGADGPFVVSPEEID